MACKRSAVRSRLPPPLSRNQNCSSGNIGRQYGQFMSPSSRGLGHHPFTVSTGVRIPVGTPNKKADIERYRPFFFFRIVVRLDQVATLIQFSVSSAGTRSNSLKLLVTSTSPSLRACAAMCRSLMPIVSPFFSRAARINP